MAETASLATMCRICRNTTTYPVQFIFEICENCYMILLDQTGAMDTGNGNHN